MKLKSDFESGKLYLCPTPIGNLEDITFRTVDTLKKVDLICAEDTRHSMKLLRYYEIDKPTTSYHEHNKYDKADYIVSKLLSGENIALVTDAGTPGISDPGQELVKKCIENMIEVVPLPGATACITALIASGKDTNSFVFEGFLGSDKRIRKLKIERNINETRTMIFYEAPHRLVETIKVFIDKFGNRNITICKELTKLHESFEYTDLLTAYEKYSNMEKIQGEFVLIISGKSDEELRNEKREKYESITIYEHVNIYLNQGYSEKESMKLVAKDRGIHKREVYSIIKGDKA